MKWLQVLKGLFLTQPVMQYPLMLYPGNSGIFIIFIGTGLDQVFLFTAEHKGVVRPARRYLCKNNVIFTTIIDVIISL